MSRKYYEKLLGEIQNQSKPVESKYGSYIMQKFGWAKGKGLGKLENGDVSIMKIRKYGEHGLGYEERQKEEDEKGGMWWENMYNNCAKKINQAGSKASLPTSEEKQERKNNENVKYSIFVKKSDTSLNSASDKCVSSNWDDQPSTHEKNSEKKKKKSATVEEGGQKEEGEQEQRETKEKMKGGCSNRPNGSEADSQVKPSEADPKWKIKTGNNALINKVAVISKATNRSKKKKKKKKWKKKNIWGKCSAECKAQADRTSVQSDPSSFEKGNIQKGKILNPG
ncbi:hypothetical protein PCYB_091660 [Plasmodium cynomolgi strain B]|uniref:G-patch domain-containing protein n=1 Tax=Plasmodium cynomolgi (strain B) TaxID=1120755 RepID=K6UVN5_PLACD|nr:hypothetical protein PCYB_091660 [Plasmodium cynomolgi strain B]GAB66380.1 hypothetical protein PCYB_091660 [Plasmodium cynomolgi strain B]